MICSTCGEPAPVDARFCPHCGSSMAAACANCGTPLVAGARFCATCGTAAPGTLVGAALDLVDGVRALGPGIQARAGVLTGEAAVTVGATNQGLVAGDIVNTASRLQSVAAPGTVLVGDQTEQAANSAIAFEPAGEQ